MDILLIISGILILLAAIIGIAVISDRKRREALKNIADELGLEFHPEGSGSLQSELAGFKLCSSGRSRKLTKLIQGQSDEVVLSIFDYQYTTGSGQHSHTHRQTVAAMQSPSLQVCDFAMRPENMLDKIGGAIGLMDIDFESHPRFSSMFVLKGSSETAVRKLFKPSVLKYFEEKKGLSVEGMPGAIILYRPKRKVSPRDIKSFLSEAYEVYGTFVDNS